MDSGSILHDGEYIEVPTALLPPSRQHRYLKKNKYFGISLFFIYIFIVLFRMERLDRANNKPLMAQPKSLGKLL